MSPTLVPRPVASTDSQNRPQHCPVGGHPVQGASQPVGVELGEDVVCSPQLLGLSVHGRTIRGLSSPSRAHVRSSALTLCPDVGNDRDGGVLSDPR
jgi:hypothetical protein